MVFQEFCAGHCFKDIFNEDDINVINFTVSDQELLQRIKKRSQEESRADDSVLKKDLVFINNLMQKLSTHYLNFMK